MLNITLKTLGSFMFYPHKKKKKKKKKNCIFFSQKISSLFLFILYFFIPTNFQTHLILIETNLTLNLTKNNEI